MDERYTKLYTNLLMVSSTAYDVNIFVNRCVCIKVIAINCYFF